MNKKSKPAKKAKSAKKAAPRSARATLSVATNTSKSVKERSAALREVPLVTSDNDASIQAIRKVLLDESEPIAVRLTALQSLQAASFSVATFEGSRRDYIAALRKVAKDSDPEMRQRALGILAREKDGFAQKSLMEGLQNPAKALVPPEKALQLLSYDIHAEAYEIAREMVDNSSNETVKREALRLLAADAKSVPVFEKILLDKGATSEQRQISAAALQGLNPDKLQARAREVLLDDTEDADIQATCLTALTHFGDSDAITKDQALRKRIQDLSGKATAQVKQGAQQFLEKYDK